MSEMRNFLPNPRPFDMSGWQSVDARKLSVLRRDDDRLLLLTHADGDDLFAFTRLTVPAGTWRFGAQISDPQGGYARNALRFIQLNPGQGTFGCDVGGQTGPVCDRCEHAHTGDADRTARHVRAESRRCRLVPAPVPDDRG